MKRSILAIIMSIIILILFFTGYSMGKGYSKTDIKSSAEIAEPILIVENNPTIEINGKKQKEYYNFNIKNYKEDGKVTQVDLEYYIEILSEVKESISFKLYKNEKEISLKNNKTENMKLGKEVEQKDNFKLEIIYDKTKNNSIDDIIQDVQIKVHSEQMKT